MFPLNRAQPVIWTNLNSFSQGCFVPILVEIGKVVLERWKCEKSLWQQQWRQRTMDKFIQKNSIKSFGSGGLMISLRLRWANDILVVHDTIMHMQSCFSMIWLLSIHTYTWNSKIEKLSFFSVKIPKSIFPVSFSAL